MPAYNKGLIINPNDVPSPRMIYKFAKMTGKAFGRGIPKKGGAAIAIGTVLAAIEATRQAGNKVNVDNILLPAECFATKFSETTGLASQVSIPKGLEKGMYVRGLEDSALSFRRASKARQVKAVKEEPKGTKRSILLEAKKPEEGTTVRRSYMLGR